MFSVTLTAAGLRYTRDDETVVTATPATARELLRHWHWRLDGIEDGYTFGDLVALLRRVEDLGALSGLLECDVAAFLAEAALPCAAPHDSAIEYLEVYTVAEMSGWATAPSRPVPPYTVWRGFHGWGVWEEPYPGCWARENGGEPMKGGIAADYLPLDALLGYPLRYSGAVQFTDENFAPTTVLLETTLTVTLGEFLHAIFWDVGFHGTPDERDRVRADIEEAAAGLREEITGDEENESRHERWD